MGLATGTNQKVLFLSQNRPLWPLRTSAILLKSWERDLKCQVIIWRSNCQVIIWRMRSSCLNILWYPVPPSCNTDPPPQMLYIVTAIPHLFQGCRFPLTHTPPVGVAVAQLYEHLCHSLQTPKIQVVVRKPPGQCNMHPGRGSCCCTQPCHCSVWARLLATSRRGRSAQPRQWAHASGVTSASAKQGSDGCSKVPQDCYIFSSFFHTFKSWHLCFKKSFITSLFFKVK